MPAWGMGINRSSIFIVNSKHPCVLIFVLDFIRQHKLIAIELIKQIFPPAMKFLGSFEGTEARRKKRMKHFFPRRKAFWGKLQ